MKLFFRLIVISLFLFSLVSGFGLTATAQPQTSPFAAIERSSPQDWIRQEQIKVYKDRVVIDLPNVTWATLTNTNSMDPLLDENANVLEIFPSSAEEINVGDVISYRTPYGLIIHRVVGIGVDEAGDYFIAQGDNNPLADPLKIRFADIHGVVVAVFY